MKDQRTGRTRSRTLVRTYAWLILASTAVSVMGALYASGSDETYEASAQVTVQPTVSPSGSFLAPTMPTEQQIAESGLVRRQAAAVLGVNPGVAAANLTVTVPVDAEVLVITYHASTARRAYDGARAFSSAYVDYRNEQQTAQPASVITPATIPSAPTSGNLTLVLGVAVFAGLFVGAGAAYAWDRVSGRLRTVGDVEAHTGLAVLEPFPHLDSGRQSFAVDAPPELAAAVDDLVSRIPQLVERRYGVSLLVTGATPGAGASTVAFQMAVSLAAMGKQVVLFCIDPDNPVLRERRGVHRRSGRPDEPDTSSLPGQVMLSTDLPGLKLMHPAQDTSPDGGPVTRSLDDLQLLVWTLCSDAIVVIDGPAVLGNQRSGLLGYVADHILLVVDVAHGLRSSAEEAVLALDHVHDKLVGCVTNRPGKVSSRSSRRRPRSTPAGRPAKAAQSR